MANQGPKLAGTGVNGSTPHWTNPANIGSPSSFASISLAASVTSGDLDASNFGFTIPTGATINGVVVKIDRKASASSAIQYTGVTLSAGGTTKTPGGLWITSVVTDTIGSSSDLWGATLTPTIVNNSSFGVTIVAVNVSGGTNKTASVANGNIIIYYTPSAGGARASASAFFNF